MVVRFLVGVLIAFFCGGSLVWATGDDCGDSCPMPYGVKSCLGIKKDDTTTTFNKVDEVQYGSKPYKIGENKGEYCMRNEKIKMGCEYIGVGEAKDKVGLSDKEGGFHESDFCCGTKLNTDVPFVGRCVTVDGAMDDQSGAVSAFPRLMKALSRIVLTLIFVGSMIMLVASGVMRASGNPGEGRKMIKRVVLSLVLLGASGIILKLINPVFFG